MPGRPTYVPRLNLAATERPRNHPREHQRHPYNDVTYRRRHRHNDITYRRPALQRDYFYRRRSRDADNDDDNDDDDDVGALVTFRRPQTLSTRDAAHFGFDRDFIHQYTSRTDDVGAGARVRKKRKDVDDGARVRLYTHDSSDPFSCTCFPRASQKTIPSMLYDQVRCPHHGRRLYQPGEQDLFTYPWTSQSYKPHQHHHLDMAYGPRQTKPPSAAATAPPFVLYNTPEPNPRKNVTHAPPYTAPENPILDPLIPSKPSDSQLRRVNRRHLLSPLLTSTQLPRLPEDKEGDDELQPLDSISQQHQQQPETFKPVRPPSLRLRTVDTAVMRRVDSELRARKRVLRALSTPRALPLDPDGFPQTPTRIFKGEYVDTQGQKYQYDIKYGKTILDGKRTRLETI